MQTEKLKTEWMKHNNDNNKGNLIVKQSQSAIINFISIFCINLNTRREWGFEITVFMLF